MFDEYYRRKWEDVDGDISPEQTEHALSLRIPFLTTSHPRWNYITGIVVGSADRSSSFWIDQGLIPTDDEVSEVGELLTSYNTYYRQSFLDAMRQFAPYDIDGGANGMYFRKVSEGDWVYRKRSWESPQWHPFRPVGIDNPYKEPDEPMSLTAVIGKAFSGWGVRA